MSADDNNKNDNKDFEKNNHTNISEGNKNNDDHDILNNKTTPSSLREEAQQSFRSHTTPSKVSLSTPCGHYNDRFISFMTGQEVSGGGRLRQDGANYYDSAGCCGEADHHGIGEPMNVQTLISILDDVLEMLQEEDNSMIA